MKYKLLNDGAQKTFAVVMQAGDEVVSSLTEFAREKRLSAAQFTAIGAFKRTTLGFFEMEKKDYAKIEVTQQTEVLCLVGDITLYKGEPKLHAHVVLGKNDGTAHGGHLLNAVVDPTLEVIVTESPSFLNREFDERTGLPLISPD